MFIIQTYVMSETHAQDLHTKDGRLFTQQSNEIQRDGDISIETAITCARSFHGTYHS